MPVVTVAPTETTVCTLDVSTKRRVCLQVVNLDATQEFNGRVYLRTLREDVLAPSEFGDFEALAAGLSVAPILDVEGVSVIELRGTMSGAGGDVRWSLS